MDVLGIPQARLVLEAQAYLKEILRNIVNKILDGVDDSQPARIDEWREQTTTAGLKRTGEAEFWS
jgi:hypothetical protein